MTFADKKKAASDMLEAVFFVALIISPRSSTFALTFWFVSFKLLTSFLSSIRVSSPSLAVLRNWMKRVMRKVTATTKAMVITKSKNWFKVSDIALNR